MPSIQIDYDSFDDAPSEMGVLPEGQYNLKVLGSYFEPYLSGNGVALVFRLQVQDGPYSGRILFHKPAYKHSSEKWQGKGHKDIRDLHRACGFETLEDTDVLDQKLFKAQVSIDSGEGKYKDRNFIRRVMKYDHPISVKKKVVKAVEAQKEQYDDDDIPF